MSTLNRKLRLIYLPFLVMTIGFILLYTLLNWLLFIKTNTLSVKQDIINFWLPFTLPWIPILIWLRPRIKLLKLTGGNGNFPFLYMFIAALAMAAPTIVAQHYLEKASGKLTALESISQIDANRPTKYYTIKNYYIDKSNPGFHTSFDVSGKYNANLNMHIYIVLPILQSEADTIASNCLAWMGIKYYKQISNKLDDTEKEEKYQAFANESEEDFNRKNVSGFTYLERVGLSEEGDGFNEAIKKSEKYQAPGAPILIAENAPFEKRSGNTLAWMFGALGIACIVWFVMLLIPKLNENTVEHIENDQPSKENEMKEFFDLLKPKPGFFVTPILIYINILVYLLMVFSGLGLIKFKASDLLNWGANYGPMTANGEWWRLLTSTFLHGGLMHLLANMYGLLFVGIFLEPILGRTKLLFFYLLTGIIASCASLWWYDATVSVGASGAIFGLYGIFVALLLTKIFPPDMGKAFLASTLVFIGYNLVIGLTGGIDNAAHIGGLVSGFVIGLLFSPMLKKQAMNEVIQ